MSSPAFHRLISRLARRASLVALVVAVWSAAAPLPARACPGDCDADGRISVADLVYGIGVALEQNPLGGCESLDRDGSASVSVDELIAAVDLALAGCPPTPTPTSTPEPTPTATVNQAPVLPSPSVYRTYPGFDVELPLGVFDPEGGAVSCLADGLPRGAALDAPAGPFGWRPAADQVGPFYVPFTCTDDAEPPGSAAGELVLQVSPPDACTVADCDPATGCETSLKPLGEPCCSGEPEVRVSEAVAGCPEGTIAFVGRNDIGFGRLQNCDQLYVRNRAQTGAEARFHVEARCLDTNNRVTIHARMETAVRLVFDEEQRVFLYPRDDGYADRYVLRFNVDPPAPFFDMQDAEADLTVTLTDGNGASVTESVRLRLTFTPVPDLPAAGASPTAEPTPTPSAPVEGAS